jgi:glucokinase
MAAVGIDIGGTQIKAAAFSRAGDLLCQRTMPTEDFAGNARPQFAENVRAMFARLCDEVGGVETVGLSAPGLADAEGRTISCMPGRMAGLEGFDWSEWLGRDVVVLNDAHAALLGEVWQGAARGLKHAILLTLGTGVGGAIWSDGRLVRGRMGRAGHFGHISLNPYGEQTIARTPGGLENWIGNHNIVERSDGRFSTTHELVAAFREGDPFAAEVWLKSIRALACGIASLINVLDPEAVIIGGGIAKAGPSLFIPLDVELDRIEWRPGGAKTPVRAALLGEWAGAYGAAWMGLLNDE